MVDYSAITSVFIVKFGRERNFKIGHHLVKLQAKCFLFMYALFVLLKDADIAR